jgi:anti-anti-sigma factor
MPFDIDTELDGGTLRVRVSGEVDMGTVPLLREAVEDHPGDWKIIAMDMSDVAFMDSSGLQELVRLSNRARERLFEFVIIRPSLPVTRLLQLTGLEPHFTIRD